MIDLIEDQIVEMEFNQHFIGESTTTTPQDIKKANIKLTATLPETSEQWKQITSSWPFSRLNAPYTKKWWTLSKQSGHTPISHLTLEGLSCHAKASILWIIHLQAHYFSQGKMDTTKPQTMCLPAFSLMFKQISSAAIHTISVASLLPAKLDVVKPILTQHAPPTRSTPPGKRQCLFQWKKSYF